MQDLGPAKAKKKRPGSSLRKCRRRKNQLKNSETRASLSTKWEVFSGKYAICVITYSRCAVARTQTHTHTQTSSKFKKEHHQTPGKASTDLKIAKHGTRPKVPGRGLNNYLKYFGGAPYYNYNMMGPKTLF